MKMYQVSFEERDQLLRPLGETGQEATGSMGDDTPMAVLSAPAAAALRLFPPAVRPGDQPADRPPARGGGDVAGDLHRPGAAIDLRGVRTARQPGHPHLAGALHREIPGPAPPRPLGLPAAPPVAGLRSGHSNICARPSNSCASTPPRRSAAGSVLLLLTDRDCAAAAAADPRPPGRRRGASPSLSRGLALQRQPASWPRPRPATRTRWPP